MCGLAGFCVSQRVRGFEPEATLQTMGASIRHRGPDDGGVLWDSSNGVGMVHRRLSIQDLSPLGAQPMVSRSGRYVIVFNGEIYNFRSLRERLEGLGASFRGHSDTEVMLAAFEAWGVAEAVATFVGMFAFAVWDRNENTLWLARDRFGEKPLYYGWVRGHFVFGSELKAIQAFPGFDNSLNTEVLPLFLRHNYIPTPYSIYDDIWKLRPAHMLRVDLDDPSGTPVSQSYWELRSAFERSCELSHDEVVNQLEQRLGDAIEDQMISDVPLGAFLSGGIDSSLVVALMQKRATQPVRTFSIGFREDEYNESAHAAAVAQHLGTAHTELFVTASDAQEVIPDLLDMYDEPFADPSQIPTHLVSRLTREHVTVALTGDGADELFAGYGRYQTVASAWARVHQSPGPRQHLERLFLGVPESVAAPAVRLISKGQRALSTDGLKRKLARERALRNFKELERFYQTSLSYCNNPADFLRSGNEPPYAFTDGIPERLHALHPIKQLMWLDLNNYLLDDILTKVDRASMSVSLETRAPFLDHRVAELALGVPMEWNVDGGVGKGLLRKILHRHVPPKLVDRPKQGFAIPLGEWLRGDLRDWAESLLSADSLRESGVWNERALRQQWKDHLEGRYDYSFHLWGCLMLQTWLRRHRSLPCARFAM